MTEKKKAPRIKRLASYVIRAIDIKEGMHIIISEWLVDVDVEGCTDASSRKLVAVPMVVQAIAMPFIVIECPTMGGLRGVLDTRKSIFMRVSEHFTTALTPARKSLT